MKALLDPFPARTRDHARASIAGFAAALALGGAAHAAAICGPARVDVGDPGRNGVVATYVAHDRNGTWTIRHTLANGMVIDRSLQYIITDDSSPNALRWRGALMRNPNLVMVGEAMKLAATGQPTYDEWLYKNGQLIMHSVALCRFDLPPATVAQAAVSAPRPEPLSRRPLRRRPRPRRLRALAKTASGLSIWARPCLRKSRSAISRC
jgi:hypothetical protein